MMEAVVPYGMPYQGGPQSPDRCGPWPVCAGACYMSQVLLSTAFFSRLWAARMEQKSLSLYTKARAASE